MWLALAELAFWFHFQPSELMGMDWLDVKEWFKQAERQSKAQYKSLL